MTNQDIRIAAARGLFQQQGVFPAEPDLNSMNVSFASWTIPTDFLVGALQQAGKLAEALICAKYKVQASVHQGTRRKGAGPELIHDVQPGDGDGMEAIGAIWDDVGAIAQAHADAAGQHVQTLVAKAQTALQRSSAHRNRTYQLGETKVRVEVVIHRDLGGYLARFKLDQVSDRLVYLAASPFRHLEVTLTVERLLRGRWLRMGRREFEVHAAPDRPIPVSRLLKAWRKETQNPTRQKEA